MSGVEIVTLPNGLRAVRDLATGQVMHCGAGPAVESRTLYVEPSRIEARLLAPGEGNLVIYDVGLGAASNALAAWRVSESVPHASRRLEIVSFDHDLAPLELAMRPEHAEAFGLSSQHEDTHAAVQAILTERRHETPRTLWRLVFGDLMDSLARAPADVADVVYWDMYSRSVCPDLWTASAFRAVARACRPGATLHTYSASTSTRSALLLGGFAVGIGPGTGDRGETTIAAIDASDLATPLDARWLARLERSSKAFPSDVPADPAGRAEALAQIRAMPQFTG